MLVKRINKKYFNILSAMVMLLVMHMPLVHLKAQDTVYLRPVNIVAERVTHFTNEINVSRSDSFAMAQAMTQNLAEVLFGTAGIQSRSYGLGGVSSMALRNGNSYQTAVLWKGINLQDPLNGGVDVSQLPGFFFDDVVVHRGGETALFGSGSMGGTVVLGSRARYNKGFQAEAYGLLASFSHLQGGIKLAFSNKNWSSGLKFFHRQAENDFPYQNYTMAGAPMVRQKNAAFQQRGLLQENAIILGKNHHIAVDFWLFESDNQVPESMSQSIESTASSLNRNAKGVFSYVLDLNKLDFKFRSAWLFNSLSYHNEISLQSYVHESQALVNEMESSYSMKNSRLMVGVRQQMERAFSESLLPDNKRLRYAYFAAYQWQRKRFSLKINARQEMLNARFLPFTWSLKGRYQLSSSWALFASQSRSYRIPTFNDLYWSDAFSRGNPSLQAEHGYAWDMGYLWKFSKYRYSMQWRASYYWNLTHDLIQWIPTQGIWSPHNFDQVSGQGVETEYQIKYAYKQHRFKLTMAYTYTESLLRQSAIYTDESLWGKQMIFVPKNSAHSRLRWIRKRLFVEYQQAFYGEVFTQVDHSASLDHYWLSNVILGYNFKLKSSILSLNGKVLNIWNVPYQTMPAYAMPGINYELSVRYKLNKS
jgi:vitamin B12 transporter